MQKELFYEPYLDAENLEEFVIHQLHRAFCDQKHWVPLYYQYKDRYKAQSPIISMHHAKTLSVFSELAFLKERFDLSLSYLWNIISRLSTISLSEIVDVSSIEAFSDSFERIRKIIS